MVDHKKRWFYTVNPIFFWFEKSGWPEKKIRVCRTTFLEPLFYTFLEKWLRLNAPVSFWLRFFLSFLFTPMSIFQRKVVLNSFSIDQIFIGDIFQKQTNFYTFIPSIFVKLHNWDDINPPATLAIQNYPPKTLNSLRNHC